MYHISAYFTWKHLACIADFLPAVGVEKSQNAEILKEITAENGLLKEQAQGWYGFLHLTLQEYFTALYVVEQQQLETLLAHRGDSWWEEVTLLYAGRVPDASPLLRQMLGMAGQCTLREDIFHTNLIWAGRCLAMRPTVREIVLRDQVITDLFKLLTKTRYSLTRNQSAETLAEIGGRGVNQELLCLLADKQGDAWVRGSIAEALGQLGERSVVPELLRLLADKQGDAWVRGSIAEVLGKLIQEQTDVHTLAELFTASREVDAVYSALWTISHRLGVRILTKGREDEIEIEMIE